MEKAALFLFLWLYSATVYTDIKYHKIKNAITFPIAAIGLTALIFQQGFQPAITIFVLALILGLLPELFRMWSTGDTKLFIAASLLSALLLNTSDYTLLLYFLGINSLLYLIAGHAYTLWKSRFKPLVYLYLLRSKEVIGKMPGALPILISNILAIMLFWRGL